MTKISIIVAADENNAIGKGNQMLCHLPNDLKHFKTTTARYPIIMGRKTFESLPKGALPNRRNIVISRNTKLALPNCEIASSLQEAIAMCKDDYELFIIGGGEIYKQSLNIADTIYLTRIHHKFDVAEIYFPHLAPSEWKEVEREEHFADNKHQYNYSFLRFEKI